MLVLGVIYCCLPIYVCTLKNNDLIGDEWWKWRWGSGWMDGWRRRVEGLRNHQNQLFYFSVSLHSSHLVSLSLVRHIIKETRYESRHLRPTIITSSLMFDPVIWVHILQQKMDVWVPIVNLMYFLQFFNVKSCEKSAETI